MNIFFKNSFIPALVMITGLLYLAPYDVKGQGSQTIKEPTKPAFSGQAKENVGITNEKSGIVKGQGSKTITEKPPLAGALAVLHAEKALEAKGTQLGFCGAPISDVTEASAGWMRSYQECEIYFGKDTGAHEVHGAIRVKYDALQGANGPLGLPLTDEQGTPDGVGRYNHFQGGSIYWSPRTQAFMVRGTIRDVWAGQGWERGPLGYPAADEYVVRPLKASADHPPVAWSLFENGAIVKNADGTHPALAAEVPPDRFRCILRTFVDREVHKSPDNVGLHPPVDTLAVSDWSYGPIPRKITFRLHGFRDMGLVLPDVDFELDMNLGFFMVPGSMTFNEPKFKTLVASPDGLRVTAHGLPIANVEVRDGIMNGVRSAFYRGGPDPSHSEVSDGQLFIASLPTGVSEDGSVIDIIGTQVTPQGGLQIVVPAGPKVGEHLGNLRQILAQTKVDTILGDAGC